MKVIQLTKGQVAIIDDEDFDRIAQWRWCVNCQGYAVRRGRKADGTSHLLIRMHKEILPAPRGFQIDHINGNKLDNRRCNLRLASHSENTRNKGARRDNKLGIKGVFFCNTYSKYVAKIMCDKKYHFLGYFDSVEQAKSAYDNAAIKLHGEFARLN